MTQTIALFDPPAFLSDFDTTLKNKWSQLIGSFFQREIQGLQQQFAQASIANPVAQFYNPLLTATGANAQEAKIVWPAFPNVATAIFPTKQAALQAAEQPVKCTQHGKTILFRPQDEYCEWFVKRDAQGKILSVTFTCEGPEYWEFLAEQNQQKLLELYQQFVDPAIQIQDLLFPDGSYNRSNKWNTTQGIMHLSHPANTLGAEIDIAAQATIWRKDAAGRPITQTKDLICCAQFGEPQRFSDPTIGHAVNSLARQGRLITLKNPVGLYIQKLDTTGWTTPDNSNPQSYWKVLRGDASNNMIVRAVYEVPSSANFTVSDIKIAGVPITFGGQIAEQITMGLTGIAFQPTPPLDITHIPSLQCIGGAVPGCPGGRKFHNLCEVAGAQLVSQGPTHAFALLPNQSDGTFPLHTTRTHR